MDEDEVDGEGCEDHCTPHPSLEGPGHHGHQGDEDGGEDVEDGSDQANPDGPLPLCGEDAFTGARECRGRPFLSRPGTFNIQLSGLTPLNILDETRT